jgi:hypothetical protein
MSKEKELKWIEGMKYDKDLIKTYRKMYPEAIESSHGLKKHDLVKYKRSARVSKKAWGKVAGWIAEIRSGRGGPLLVSATSAYSIGPKIDVAFIAGKNRTIHFADTRDLIKIE